MLSTTAILTLEFIRQNGYEVTVRQNGTYSFIHIYQPSRQAETTFALDALSELILPRLADQYCTPDQRASLADVVQFESGPAGGLI
jgi:hypothetical protein